MIARALPLLLAGAVMLPLAAHAGDATPQSPRITVTGQGEIDVAPDMAIVTLSVMREAETARAALDENNEAMAEVIAALKDAGVADRDLQTSGLSINPRYVYPQNGNGEELPRIVAYQVANTLTIRVRELDGVGGIIDRAVTLGVNQGGSISFVNDDPRAARMEARKRAVADALERARVLAEAAGAELGNVMEISEQSAPQPPMPMGQRMMRMEATADAAVPIEAGENTYRIDVNVTFELKP